MKTNALVYCENEFGNIDGKVANGLIRQSETYTIVGIIDSSKAGQDAGEYLDGTKNNIPIFESIAHAIKELSNIPKYFIYGIAPLASFLNDKQKDIIFTAMKSGMNIVNGLPEFFNDNPQYTNIAQKYGVTIHDVRKPPARENLHNFTGRIRDVKIPIITVMGTDCAVGKRTSGLLLVENFTKGRLECGFRDNWSDRFTPGL